MSMRGPLVSLHGAGSVLPLSARCSLLYRAVRRCSLSLNVDKPVSSPLTSVAPVHSRHGRTPSYAAGRRSVRDNRVMNAAQCLSHYSQRCAIVPFTIADYGNHFELWPRAPLSNARTTVGRAVAGIGWWFASWHRGFGCILSRFYLV